jgi:ankyrin repeat protein
MAATQIYDAFSFLSVLMNEETAQRKDDSDILLYIENTMSERGDGGLRWLRTHVDSDGRTLAHFLCVFGAVKSLQALCDDKTPLSTLLNTSDKAGWTPAMSAASSGQLDIIARLISDIEEQQSPSSSSSSSSSSLFIKVFAAVNDRGCNVLHYACSKGHVDIVRAICERCPLSLSKRVANATDAHGETPLFRAVSADHDDVARVLVECAGANVLVRNRSNESALSVAVAAGDDGIELVSFLLEHGAVVSEDDVQAALTRSAPLYRLLKRQRAATTASTSTEYL